MSPRMNAPDFSDVQTVAASARTANGVAATISSGTRGKEGATCVVNVTASSGTTPGITFRLEESLDNIVWATLVSSAEITASPAVVPLRYIGPHGPYLRLAWTVTGTTPSFTFSHRIQSD